MKRQLAVLVLAVSALAADKPADDAKKALKELQGTWKVEQAKLGGIAGDKEVIEKMTVEIRDNKITIKDGIRDEVAEMKLDPGQKPAWLDFTPVKEKSTFKGIYELDGDTLKLCWTKEGKDRPTAFESKEGTDSVLFVLKRQKK
jgi:uncharacterized protein (TIGR03067 family)